MKTVPHGSNKANTEGQEPWSQPVINRMPALPSVDVPNGVAHPTGPRSDGPSAYVKGEFIPIDDWGGNRTGE